MNSIFYNNKVLVTGGNGMIGKSLIKELLNKGAFVYCVDIKTSSNKIDNVEYIESDLRNYDNCVKLCSGMDYIFHLAGIKGSPKRSIERPADFFVPMLQFNTNMMEAAFRCDVKWFLYTSSVGVYAPSEVFYEDDVWSTFPSKNDRYPGWAKRMGELQAEVYKVQYDWDKVSIVRPANVYGPNDNFDLENSMVIPSLIRKAQEMDILEVWGDGSPLRDFIFCDDVARGMISVVENKVTQPVNLGSGIGYTIRQVVDLVVKYSGKNNEVKWLTEQPSGDKIRLFDTKRAESFGIKPSVDLDNGIKLTTEWYKKFING